MRVVVADPPAFTPWYDHELAASLARAGLDVELATSRFRFGAAPDPDGYARTKLTNAVLEKRLGVRATSRNWRTVEALAELTAKA